MLVEIWSDVVCPWCYIGKRRFERAMDRFAHADEVEVLWRSYELDPGAPARAQGDMASHLARKYGISLEQARARQAQVTEVAAAEGLEYRLARTMRSNTFDAHRALHLARERGLQGALKERLMRAYFTEGQPVGERDVLRGLAAEVGLDLAEVDAVLESDAYAAEVREDEERATEVGAHGVPFLVVDKRYRVSGAQDASRFVQLLDRAWLDSHPLARASGGEGPVREHGG